ncbi:MAG: RDD family protein [Pseudomonadota bacterium]|nr:RDD family protein [Pseudomonadota bacterium]
MRPPTPPDLPAVAGLWPRTAAWCVDALLLGMPTALLSAALPVVRDARLLQHWRALGEAMGWQMQRSIRQGDDFLGYMRDVWAADGLVRAHVENFHHALLQGLGIPLLIFILLGLLYWPLLESGRKHATLGKRWVGLQVRAGHAPLGLGRAFKRHLAGGLSWLTLNIGHLLITTGEHRALHDRIADTYVVWRPNATQRTPWWGRLLIALVMALPWLLAVLAGAQLSAAMAASLAA